ncbi:hypothetical protein FQN50_009128 [Emmonsiellopsis sp. PD_5]|nr:hypothetical protein FQN50_009128 [Emmonsiellopsis sp. PD_5]
MENNSAQYDKGPALPLTFHDAPGPVIVYLNNQIAQMYYKLFQAESGAQQDSLLIEQLKTECSQYQQQLDQESTAHSKTWEELQRQLDINTQLRFELREAHTAQATMQQAYNMISAEPNRSVKRFHHFNSPIYPMRLEQDKKLDPQNQSRRITSIISGIKSRVRGVYRARIKEGSARMANLAASKYVKKERNNPLVNEKGRELLCQGVELIRELKIQLGEMLLMKVESAMSGEIGLKARGERSIKTWVTIAARNPVIQQAPARTLAVHALWSFPSKLGRACLVSMVLCRAKTAGGVPPAVPRSVRRVFGRNQLIALPRKCHASLSYIPLALQDGLAVLKQAREPLGNKIARWTEEWEVVVDISRIFAALIAFKSEVGNIVNLYSRRAGTPLQMKQKRGEVRISKAAPKAFLVLGRVTHLVVIFEELATFRTHVMKRNVMLPKLFAGVKINAAIRTMMVNTFTMLLKLIRGIKIFDLCTSRAEVVGRRMA